jgi:hypothetical protein
MGRCTRGCQAQAAPPTAYRPLIAPGSSCTRRLAVCHNGLVDERALARFLRHPLTALTSRLRPQPGLKGFIAETDGSARSSAHAGGAASRP